MSGPAAIAAPVTVEFVADDELPPAHDWAIVCRPSGYVLVIKYTKVTPRNLSVALGVMVARRASQLAPTLLARARDPHVGSHG